MNEWEQEQAAFLEKVGQAQPAKPTPAKPTKKDEE